MLQISSEKIKKKNRKHDINKSIVNIKNKIETCEALHENNLTFNMEMQKQIIEINNGLKECEALQQLNDGHINVMSSLKNVISEKNDLFSNSIGLKNLLAEFETALNIHNNTIKTHFKLNDAYNIAVLERIEEEMSNLNKMNENVNADKQKTNTKSQSVKTHSHIIACNIGRVSIKPLNSRNSIDKLIKIHIYNANCKSLADARQFFTETITAFTSTNLEKDIEWFTTKMVFNKISQDMKRINLIAKLPINIDTVSLTAFIGRVFGDKLGA